MSDTEAVTLVKGAIHNPSEPRHFMRVVPAGSRQVARVGDRSIADSTAAMLVKEVGRDIYDPVVYFPRADVDMAALAGIDKSTHCPLKGDTEYFDIEVDGERVSEAAWSYVEMVEGAEILRELVAFDGSKVALSSD